MVVGSDHNVVRLINITMCTQSVGKLQKRLWVMNGLQISLLADPIEQPLDRTVRHRLASYALGSSKAPIAEASQIQSTIKVDPGLWVILQRANDCIAQQQLRGL